MMRMLVRVGVTLALVMVAVFAGYELWRYYMLSPWTRDARIRADVITLAPDVSGWVEQLKVVDNQAVKAGDLLLTIDHDRFEATLQRARAVAETQQQKLKQSEHQAQRRTTIGAGAVSAELLENAQIDAKVARAAVDEALADVRLAEIDLARSTMIAPRSGQVTNLQLAQGNYVNTGQSIMALVDDSTFYVLAYFEETKLPRVKVGDPVKIWLMSTGEPMRGHVQSISRGITDANTNPDQQLLAEVEPTFNWVRLAQRIPVRIKIDQIPEGGILSAGMTASVQVEHEEKPDN
jgi:RND family efflux transporter MFP subunit